MAEFPSVPGPMRVSTNVVSPTFANLLGITTSDGRPRFSRVLGNEPVVTEAFGNSPEDYIYLGGPIVITMTLVKIDQDELGELMKRIPGATEEGQLGIPGSLWVRSATPSAFELQLAPTIDPGVAENITHTYEFKRVILDPTIEYSEFGNSPTLLDLPMVAIPDDSGVVYTKVPTFIPP